MRCFVVADLHLGHKKIIEYEPARQHFASIEEHDDCIETRWRETVGSRDVIYIVGDVVWNRAALERLRCFPGIKKLVMGNHDRHDMQAYLGFFRKVTAYSVLDRDVLLAHVPVHPQSLRPRFRAQIHGHIHGRTLGPPYINVCV